MTKKALPLLVLAVLVMPSVPGIGGCGENNGNNGNIDEVDDWHNTAPSPSAGIDQTVYEQTIVTLAGSVADTHSSITDYKWTQTAGTMVDLNSPEEATTTFTAPAVITEETLVFQFIITDDKGANASANVDVTIIPMVDVSGSIMEDTVWLAEYGPYEVIGLLSVAPDTTLTIMPGTLVKVGGGVKVAGDLIAQGTVDEPIFFGPISDNGSWGGIKLESSQGSYIEFCIFENASSALMLDGGSTPVVRNNVFRCNSDAITDSGGYQPMVIEYNTFLGNSSVFSGIRTSGESFFRYNTFTGNENVFEYGYYFGTVTITSNNFINNDFVIRGPEYGYGYGAVSACDNWWGTTDTTTIDELIYDIYDDATLQVVAYEPIQQQELVGIGSAIHANVETPGPQM